MNEKFCKSCRIFEFVDRCCWPTNLVRQCGTTGDKINLIHQVSITYYIKIQKPTLNIRV